MLDKLSQYIKTHEKLCLAALILAVVLFCGNKYLNISAKEADSRAAIAQEQLKQQKDANTQLATQSEKAAQDYQNTIITMQQQNASLIAAITKRDAALKTQQNVDRTMPLPALASRWKSLIQSGDVSASGTGLAVNEEGARSTVNELEKVPVLEAKVSDTETIAADRQTEIDKANVLIGGLNKQVTGLNATVAGEESTCKLELDQQKKDDRKSKANWFKAGVIIGFVSGVATHLIHF